MKNVKATYKHTYFRVEAGYLWGSGMDKENFTAFSAEVKQLFLNNGWQVKKDTDDFGGCLEVERGNECLYCHPMDLSGAVLEKSIPEIETFLKEAKTFQYKKTDIYENVYEISDEDYLADMKSRQSIIEDIILGKYKTKRKNLFVPGTGVLFDIARNIAVKRIGYGLTGYSSDQPEHLFVKDVFQQLLDSGKIVSTETKRGTAYRTI